MTVIIRAATDLLDGGGESALTLRALTTRLKTGYGAVYHHVADKNDLLAAATDEVVARVLAGVAVDAESRQALRGLALGLFGAVGALMNYVPGVAEQNAAQARSAEGADRAAFLAAVADRWSRLDPGTYPFVRKAAARLPEHDDREQFLAGIDIFLAGVATLSQQLAGRFLATRGAVRPSGSGGGRRSRPPPPWGRCPGR
ncbi:DNA-binding transcriptional regulator, AcrR family [Amycolatopsis sacchari]|uniref:DNA-binding transcriptional regulator, AcrR family n=1 Tax=Amycolatopsis sacchari TaxID=115433 RepID=A0A1I3RGG8_9PSEU|nr:DNA-binding transcriptional regulator, AcrR family [Amycolatopsis sacchari]